ncbi:MAG: hypothetical protein PHV55_08210 [Candidatus Omnitrophica bacterium]|nr:hypothetical protein [Candidatus Omnitrophota bacterium]
MKAKKKETCKNCALVQALRMELDAERRAHVDDATIKIVVDSSAWKRKRRIGSETRGRKREKRNIKIRTEYKQERAKGKSREDILDIFEQKYSRDRNTLRKICLSKKYDF